MPSFELPITVQAPWAIEGAQTDAYAHEYFRQTVELFLEGAEAFIRWRDASSLLVRVAFPNGASEDELAELANTLHSALDLSSESGETVSVGRFLRVATRKPAGARRDGPCDNDQELTPTSGDSDAALNSLEEAVEVKVEDSEDPAVVVTVAESDETDSEAGTDGESPSHPGTADEEESAEAVQAA